MFKIFSRVSEYFEISTVQVMRWWLMTAVTAHMDKIMWGGFILAPGSRNFYSIVPSTSSGEAEHRGKRNVQKKTPYPDGEKVEHCQSKKPKTRQTPQAHTSTDQIP